MPTRTCRNRRAQRGAPPAEHSDAHLPRSAATRTYRRAQRGALLILFLALTGCAPETPKLLVFTRTEGFRHQSIEAGVHAVLELARERGLDALHTEDPAYFSEDSLRAFSAVVFLNTTGDVLDYRQQADFERFIQAGGGFVGVHAASDTEYDWPWYGKLVGAYFASHPRNQEAVVEVTDRSHAATEHLPASWSRVDEWYNFREAPSNVNILAMLDESSYEGGSMDGNHPITWYHEYDGGRAFYTAMGHTEESYADSLFLGLLDGAIQYAVGSGRLNYRAAQSARVPEEDRFTREILTAGLNEPMSLAVLDENRILFVERHGTLRLFDRSTSTLKTAAEIPVFSGNEDGLLGVAPDPDFASNNWLYLFYSPPGDKSVQHVSRFSLVDDSLDLSSEVVILEIPMQRVECCHSAGSLEFGPDGNLYISVGDNTNPFASDGFAPIDERPGRSAWDAQGTSANTNDFRGSILRIKPNEDGSYSIPKNNLFPLGTDGAKPEIYAMGLRNPFRISIDNKSGFLYWGDVGPDAGNDDSLRGPRGYDLINQARGPGFWGWPLVRGNRYPYRDYNFETGEHGPLYNPDAPINDSPNNTGRRELPPVAQPFVWYPYAESPEFPWTGTGGRTAMAGPIYHLADYNRGPGAFPDYFDGKLIAYEWIRDWMYVITMDEDGDFEKAEPFLPSSPLDNPIDMAFGPDGSLYVLEYGETWNAANPDARLNRITYTAGNRAPVAALDVEPLAGALPLSVTGDASRSSDPDNDELDFVWTLDGKPVPSDGARIRVELDAAGEHELIVTVLDNHGASSIRRVTVTAGNEPPDVEIRLAGNQQFFWPSRRLEWQVDVADDEDGVLGTGIVPADVHTTLLFEPAGLASVSAGPGTPAGKPASDEQDGQDEQVYGGQTLIERSDCAACHAVDRRINGPAYRDIAGRYTEVDLAYLTRKVIAGGSGVWGGMAMSAHPQLDPDEVELMIRYILSTGDTTSASNVATSGSAVVDAAQMNVGRVILSATYTDRGAIDVAGIERSDRIVLVPPHFEAEALPLRSEGATVYGAEGATLVGELGDGAYLGLRGVDLTDIRSVELGLYFVADYNYRGTIELRIGSPDGELAGSTNIRHQQATAARVTRSIPIDVADRDTPRDVYIVFRTSPTDHFVANVDWVGLRS